MICTCTMNPSLDYYMEFETEPKVNEVNRSTIEYYEAGGKGINVSIVLNNLGIPSKAFGFVGGFTKDFYISLLAKYENIRPAFTYTEGNTRINVKLRTEDRPDTNLNAMGPVITHEDMQNLERKVSMLYEQDYFVLAGNTPEYLSDDTKAMLTESIRTGVKVVLDTNPDIMRDMISEKPFLYKTTPEELGLILNRPMKTRQDVVDGARELYHAGVKHILVVRDNEEGLMISRKGTYYAKILSQGVAVNTVGTGDSMVAGFLMDYLRTGDSVDSFRFGASCGSATAYSKGLATRAKIDAMYENTEIVKVEE